MSRSCYLGSMPPLAATRVQYLSRVMRPPGTQNYKGARNGMSPTACSLISCNPGLTYPHFGLLRLDGTNGLRRTDVPRLVPGTRSLPYAATGCHDNVTTLAARLDCPRKTAVDEISQSFATCSGLAFRRRKSGRSWPTRASSSRNGRPYFDLTFANAEKTVSPWAEIRLVLHRQPPDWPPCCSEAARFSHAIGLPF